MAMQPPGPQQEQPQGQPNIPPELLMVLLSHLAATAGQQPGSTPAPKDGSQTPSIADLIPHLLQALTGPQQPQTGANPGAQQQQQGPKQQPTQQGQPQAQQQNPLASILQSLGIKLQ